MGLSGRAVVDQDLEVVRLVLHRTGRGVKKPFRGFGGALEPVPKIFEIQYGHNATTRQVVMLFNQLTAQIVLTPEDAEHMAKQLLIQVEAARGGSGKTK